MLAGNLSNVDVEVATALEEAHVRDTRTFFTRTRFTRGGGAIIQVSHRITIAIVTRLVNNILEFVLLSFAAFLLAQDARIFDLLLEAAITLLSMLSIEMAPTGDSSVKVEASKVTGESETGLALFS